MNENIKVDVVEETEFLQVPVANITNGNIDCDFTKLKSQVKAKVEDYKLLVLNEDNYREIADTKAGINKTIDALKKHRTTIKKAFLKPFEKFNDDVDDIIKIMEEAKVSLESQLNDFNDKLEDEKKKAILDYFNGLCENKNFHMIKIENIWNKKWLNKTFKADDIKKDISNCLLRINNAINTLANYDDYRMLIQEFLDKVNYDNLNDDSLLNSIIVTYSQRKKKAEEMVQPKVVEPKVEPKKEDTTGELISFNLTIRDIGKEKALALNNYLKANGIKYELKVIK